MSAEVFGREAELEELAKLLEPLRHGSSVRVGLMGDAGVGKTTLLDLAAWRVGVSTVRIASRRGGRSWCHGQSASVDGRPGDAV